jgi:hypothetical protein
MIKSAGCKLISRSLTLTAVSALLLQLLSLGFPGNALAKSAPSAAVLNGRAKAILMPVTTAYLKLYSEEQADGKLTPVTSADKALDSFNQNFANLKSPQSLGDSKTAYNKAVRLYKNSGFNAPSALADWESDNESVWAGIANWGLDESTVLTDEIAYGKPSKADEAALASQVELNNQGITATQNNLSALSQAITLKVSGVQPIGNNKFKVSVVDTPGTKLNLFANGKKVSSATINVNDTGSFNNVGLAGTGKLSFTRSLQSNKKTIQKPAGSTTYFSVNANSVALSSHAFVPKSMPKPTPKATPVPVVQVTPMPVPVAPVATAQSCTPLSDEGTCYEPGEYCRNSDHGASGVAGDGESITCTDNDGWRWEPS